MRSLFYLCAGVTFFFTGVCAAEIPKVAWQDLTDQAISPYGKAALSTADLQWQHAQTEHFVYHFTNEKETETVYIHAEVYYQWVKELFGVKTDSWKKKGHIFIFEKEAIWNDFKSRTDAPFQGDAFTNGWELFIYRSPFWLSPKKTLAHEITHLIVFRFLEGPVPLFLNEGFAEFVSYKAIATQFDGNEYNVRMVQLLKPEQVIPLDQLIQMRDYPESLVETFYQQSELVVRFLILNYGSQKFYTLLRDVSKGKPFQQALKNVYDLDRGVFEEKWKEFAIAK